MDDLIAFVRARLDEDAAVAWAIHDVARCDALLYEEDLPGAAARTPDCDCGYPARALREVAAGRKLITFALENAARIDGEWGDCHGPDQIAAGLCSDYGADAARDALAPLAAVYSDHPDYDPEWQP